MPRRLPARHSVLSRVVSAIVLLVVFAVSFALGAVLFLVIVGAVAVLGVAFYLRFRWLKHKLQQTSPPRRSGDVLEGEYTVRDAKPPTRP